MIKKWSFFSISFLILKSFDIVSKLSTISHGNRHGFKTKRTRSILVYKNKINFHLLNHWGHLLLACAEQASKALKYANSSEKGEGDWIWALVANHVRILMSTSGKWSLITHWHPLKTWRNYHKNSLRFFGKQKMFGYALSANMRSRAQNPAQKYASGEKNTIKFSKILFHQWLNFLMSASGNFRLSIE